MSCSVYAEGMGFFHKGSGGSATAPGDVCLTPPPPPAGPLPVPYVNKLSAGDLSKGSRTVKIEGNPTALEDSSEVSTSTGNEAATQGGGVVTHKTKGKGHFTLWSFSVFAEGKGVDCHGHPMMQNTSCTPPNIVCVKSEVAQNLEKHGFTEKYECTPCEAAKYKHNRPTDDQKDKANKDGKAAGCWTPNCPRGMVNTWTTRKGKKKTSKKWTADHQPPQAYVWHHLGGCKGACDKSSKVRKAAAKKFKDWAQDLDTCKPHCRMCSNSQGGYTANYWGHEFVDMLINLMGGVA